MSLCFRKGKVKPLSIVEKDETGRFLKFFTNMGEKTDDLDIDTASEFVCRMYSIYGTCDVNEARHKKLMQMTGNFNKVGKPIHTPCQ